MPRYPIYNNGVRTSNNVAITFDDGPNPPRILDGLKARGLQPVRLDEMELDEPTKWDGLLSDDG